MTNDPSLTASPALMVEAVDLYKSFGNLQVLDGVSMNIHRGEVVALIGPSGSGKSTLLRCLNHLEIVDRGQITIGNEVMVRNDAAGRARYVPEQEIRRIGRRMGMVFQHFNLFPHFTVLENLIEAPITVKKMKREQIVPKAEALLDKVGLLSKRDAYPNRLSGGQKQRVAIARALAMEPDILLFDEPTSALDPELTGEVLRTMRQLANEHMTMLVVTHEMAFAREVAHRVCFMDQGKLVENRPAAEFFDSPRHERARAFLEHVL